MIKALSRKHNYDPDRLKALSLDKLETLRANAVRLEAQDLVDLCDNELQSRPSRKRRKSTKRMDRESESDVVTGYHFVCAADRGVKDNGDDTFWTGSWVVAEANVKKSLKYEAYVALHEAKSESSYRQGIILGYRFSPREMIAKEADGIEFLVKPTHDPYDWIGGGTGEKGYQWSKTQPVKDSK